MSAPASAEDTGIKGRLAALLTPGRKRRWTVAVVAGVLVMCVLVTVAIVSEQRGDQVDGPVGAAFQERPSVPKGPLVHEIPPFCGVSERTVHRYASGEVSEQINSADEQTCTWDSDAAASTFGGGDTELEVSVSKSDEEPENGRPSVSDAAREFSRELDDGKKESTGTKGGEVFTLSGLGQDAVGWDQIDIDGVLYPDGKITNVKGKKRFTTVLLRSGNVVVEVKYGGSTFARVKSDKAIEDTEERALSRSVTRAGALATAKDIASTVRLGTSGKPHVRKQRTGKVARVPKPCTLVPAKLRREIAPSATPKPTDGYLLDDNEESDGTACETDWDRSLEVEVASAARGPHRLTGEESAVRRFTSLYLEAREHQPAEYEEGYEFKPLSGPGEQAFLAYTDDDTLGKVEVVFRVDDVLVRIKTDADEGSSKSKAMNDAYRVAVAAAKQLE